LKPGKNIVKVETFSNYSNDGYGLHSFTDQVDQMQYIYTQFEPSYSHYVFPNFDQPDIKAKWTFNALVSKDWDVISNELSFENPTLDSQKGIKD